MSSNNRFIFRRTDTQQRFEVLWQKRLEGEPTLKELAEMDEIINWDPLVCQFVLEALENGALPPGDGEQKAPPPAASPLKKTLEKVRSFFKQRGISFIQTNYCDELVLVAST
ncbi:MAG: hypothetical protein V4592_07905 [Bacteroidota bacterium]